MLGLMEIRMSGMAWSIFSEIALAGLNEFVEKSVRP